MRPVSEIENVQNCDHDKLLWQWGHGQAQAVNEGRSFKDWERLGELYIQCVLLCESWKARRWTLARSYLTVSCWVCMFSNFQVWTFKQCQSSVVIFCILNNFTLTILTQTTCLLMISPEDWMTHCKTPHGYRYTQRVLPWPDPQPGTPPPACVGHGAWSLGLCRCRVLPHQHSPPGT